jgi:PERQ amino acid-rich with GYF domain-containing protein
VARQPSPPARRNALQESQNNVQAWLSESHQASGNEWGQVPENSKSSAGSEVHTDEVAQETSVTSDSPVAEVNANDQVVPASKKSAAKKKFSPAQEVPIVSLPKPKDLPLQTDTAEPSEESKPAPAAATTAAKAPWAVEDDSKQKATAAPISLREIQELEMKKQEAKKAAVEKEKDRVAKSPATTETTFTASWGLPTSQAGARVQGVSTPKETPATSTPAASSPSPVPVWTNAVKPAAKKSMKEIQEEEERRKQMQAKESVAATVKRAYGETAAKVRKYSCFWCFLFSTSCLAPSRNSYWRSLDDRWVKWEDSRIAPTNNHSEYIPR